MEKEVKITIIVKPAVQTQLTLTLRVYSHQGKLQYFWRTPKDSEYFLEILTNDKNYIYADNINKDPRILTVKETIAIKMMEKIPIMH